MPHATPLIATIVAGLTVAFVLGTLAHRLKVSPLVGYLLAGVLVGPFTPGYVADQELAMELAEIGVILLMFGVGLHFSLKDLLAVRSIAIPGALGQMGVATALGMGLGHWLGWNLVAGLVFGLALSVASTVVLLRALQEHRILQTDRGRIAVGWLIVEDLAMVLALVLLPALAGALAGSGTSQNLVWSWLLPLAITVGKVAAFVAFMLIVGRWVIPWVLHYVAHTGQRELFRLAVLVIALGVAFGAASLFGVSFALGAFFAGMVLAESELSQRAAQETLPLRDAFAVLFFVSVGMLFNPSVILAEPWPLLGTIAIIIVGKSLAAMLIVTLYRHDASTVMTIAASLAQIGEFSFILASLGVGLGLLPEQGRNLILAGAIISIVVNPLLFTAVVRRTRPRAAAAGPDRAPRPANDLIPTTLTEHMILVGYGRVGTLVAEGLHVAGLPFLVIEVDEAARRRARDDGLEVIDGNAADPRVLAAAGIRQARRVIIAIPDGFEAGGVVQEARRSNPAVNIIARAHSDAEVEHLTHLGADETIMGERELAVALLSQIRKTDGPDREPEDLPLPPAALSSPERRLMLTDPEWALLAGVHSANAGPGYAVAKSSLYADAERLGGFGQERLAEALQSLVEKGCLAELGDGRVRVTRMGFVAATSAPRF